ncbi:MAG: TonB-dependent receptor [Proteobacteria bacterium]|nr:TonB-dependent receptor [Pseudomonadota bacterium]
MRRRPARTWRNGTAIVLGALFATPAVAQTPPNASPAPSPLGSSAGASTMGVTAPGTAAPGAPAAGPAAPDASATGTSPTGPSATGAPGAGTPGSAADALSAITVTAKRFDEARSSIQPSLGASKYEFTPESVEAIPQGQNAPLNQVLLRAPSVVQDSFGQIHVRGDHGNVQYRLDGVQLPEGLSLFTNALLTQYAANMALIDGALPAQYGFRTAGIVDITVKSGRTDPGAEGWMTLGSYNWQQPSASYGGASGKYDYFVTGQFLHNAIGIENPTSSSWPIHDATDQWHALGKLSAIVDEDTRLSFIFGGSNARFQIPNSPGQTPQYTVNGISSFNSLLLDERQWEQTYFGIASLQKHYGTADFQLSAFARYSGLAFQPDTTGDLMFNGISPWATRTDLAAGFQGDGSWKVSPSHTLRAGFLVQREHATSLTNAQVLPVDSTGATTSDTPMGITYGSDLVGWMYGVYLQDEWKLSPTVTLNYGARFDAYSATVAENQLSPRINAVWEPNKFLTAHLGYARYFTPPPLSQVGNTAIAVTAGTTAAPALTQNSPVRAERANYFDAGFEVRPMEGLKFGFDAYYKIAQNLLDEGQFGAPIILTSFNYANAKVKGVELTGSYDSGPWSVYGNVAWMDAQGTNINSAQYNFSAADLAYIAQNYIYLDHNQSVTGSAGVAYTFNPDSEWATRVSSDVLLGSGLRSDLTLPSGSSIPNGRALPYYAVVNLSAAQKLPIKGTRGATVRLDILNLFDSSYQIRDGTGVGVGAPQYGLRRTFLVTLAQKF